MDTSWTTLLSRREGSVLHLVLNRPESRNAMSLQMVEELLQALREAEADPAIRVIVLRGAQGHFCSGGDIKDMAAARMRPAQEGQDPIASVNAYFGELCLAFARTPLAVIAVLEGTVMGGGFGLACVADIALAGHSASFRLPETSLGLVPAQIAPFLVQRLGYSQARRLAVSGGQLDANQALALGLVHETYANATDLEAALASNIASILRCAPGAVAATKTLMDKARLVPAQDLIEEAAMVFARAARSAEGQEGGAAFLQKRLPTWAVQSADSSTES
jgi:isohexenylglutaconyl-CoA hydratase